MSLSPRISGRVRQRFASRCNSFHSCTVSAGWGRVLIWGDAIWRWELIAIWSGDVLDERFRNNVDPGVRLNGSSSAADAQRGATTQQTCDIKGLKIFTVVGSAVGPPVWKRVNMEGSVSAQEQSFRPQASRLECSNPASKGSFTGNLSRFRDNSRSPNPGSDDKGLRQGANWRLMTDPWRHQVLCAYMSRLLLQGGP